VLIFNRSPRDAFTFLSTALNPANPQIEFAYFMHVTEELDKAKIGRVLGGSDELDIKILSEYCGLLDFGSLEYDKALRLFLQRFRLPGEA
jgi:Sec7-like guanine-nucleotide exchange factor